MKRLLTLLLSMIMLMTSFVIPAQVGAAESTKAEKEAAEQLFQYLSPSDERVTDIYNAYKAKDYKKALALYRNYFIDKLRVKNVGPTGWHDSNIAATYVGMADILAGKITVEQFAQKCDGRAHYNYLDWWGNPDEAKPINWLGGMDVAANAQDNGQGHEIHFRHLNKLGGAYWTNNGDPIYLKKYMQILDDFCLNHKKVTEQYLNDNPNYEPDARFWMPGGKYAQGYLWRFERLNNIAREIAYFAKLLPGIKNGEKPEWANVGDPVDTVMSQEDYELFDPLIIAHYAYSVITDHLESIQNVLGDGFLITNQHNEGVITFAKMRELFDEFTILEQYDERLTHAMEALIEGVVFADGSFAERSFNYNASTAEGYTEIVEWMESSQNGVPEYAQSYLNATKGWDRLKYAYRTSTGQMPMIGNGGNTQSATPIWRDEKAYQDRVASVKIDEKADYTSVYLPFGGYGTMLSGRSDMLNDMSLNFYNNNKASAGHIGQYANGVTLTAYGRPLITSGGCPWYGEGFAPESQLPYYDVLNAYFEEDSTYKGSTLIVNGANQAKSKIPVSEILTANWMAGENFDFADGIWDGGYVQNGKTVNSAVHNRNFIFVKQAGLYIVEDEVENRTNSSNTYSQIWRMPGYTKDVANFTGFTNEQVILDEGSNLLKTEDKTGPNVWISNFSSNDLEYVKYYGQLEPRAIGWTNSGTSGERKPAADVHISWKDEAKETTKVASVLAPVKDSATPYKSKTDLSDKEKGITGFEYITEDDIKITYYSSAQPQEMTYKDIVTTANILLVTEQEGKPLNAIVKGAASVTVGDKVINTDKNGFEFTVTEEGASMLNEIYVPSYFKWVEREDGSYYPKYDSLSEQVMDEMKSAVDNKTAVLRILTYRDSGYLLGHSERAVSEINTYLPSLPQSPSDESMLGVVDAVNKFVIKNTEIGEYYLKAEYSNKLIAVFKALFDECAVLAKENRDLSSYYSAYKNIMQVIIDCSKKLNANNENITLFESKLTEIENNSTDITAEENVDVDNVIAE